MRTSVLLLFLFTACTLHGQFGALHMVDSDQSTSSAITRILGADLDQDGLQDILVSQGFGGGSIAWYRNLGNDAFSEQISIDPNAPGAECVVAADLNGDGLPDVAAVLRTSGQVVWYPNQGNGDFGAAIVLDTAVFFLNALVAADFDADGLTDLVVIGQHSIDLFRNAGNGQLVKENILTTQTSPNILECMSLEYADLDGDGDLDLLVGETLGLVVYWNNGSGVFTPQVLTAAPSTTVLVYPADVDDDGDMDIMVRRSTNMLQWYRNDGPGTFTYMGDLFPLIQTRRLLASDLDGDGTQDLYFGYSDRLVARLNTGDGTFPQELLGHEAGMGFIHEVALADLDNDGTPELIWASLAGGLGYFRNDVLTSAKTHIPTSLIRAYPNPTAGPLHVEVDAACMEHIVLRDAMGKVVMERYERSERITVMLDAYPSGMYQLEVWCNGQRSLQRVLLAR